MADKYLYEKLIEEFGKRNLAQIEIPLSLKDNLNRNFEMRPYQVDAFQRFICYHQNDLDFKEYPNHLLYNMATGSGKTLIMAGLILYLYEQGYRNFLFFVNSTNIIEKTRDNFLNPSSIKYLFNKNIFLSGRNTKIVEVANFESVNCEDINICFSTIHKLHSDLTNLKENSLTFEDFRKHKVVLIADEAHHMSASTRQQMELLESTWENTIQEIFRQRDDNILLEFTATHDYTTEAMVEKYRSKVIFRYDLLQFRNDGFSKDVVIVQSDFNLNERILQALILSQYKKEVAAKYRIHLKPVILFKAQRTISQSEQIKADFHRLIEALTAKQITSIRKSDIPLMQRAFQFFDSNKISDAQMATRIKQDFQSDFCLSVNDDDEKERYQILVNTLEDRGNPIRAIFAVQKLNEGWDVLNLFDIVRCYETRDSGRAKIGSTTMSEAQLIGRGARYFPFVIPRKEEKFKRKFDGDLEHELRVIEELHYHSVNDNRYIPEIRQALVDQGMLDKNEVRREIKLKDSFKKTPLYKLGVVWVNDRQPKTYQNSRSFADLGVKRRNYVHVIATGHGGATIALEGSQNFVARREDSQDIKVSEIERNIIQSAIARNPFYSFANIRNYFPALDSMITFISSKNYLSGLEITFQGNLTGLRENAPEKLAAVSGLLAQIEAEIRSNTTPFEGTKKFRQEWIRDVFVDKILKFENGNPLANADPDFNEFVSKRTWFATNTLYGTSEEKNFVRMLDRQMLVLNKKYRNIFLLRNEGHFGIYDFEQGRRFQPDFVLFLQEKSRQMLIYQLFIEPKGKHLKENDRWKEQFLEQIRNEFGKKVITFRQSKYRILGVPFYNSEDENIFRDNLRAAI